MYLSQFATLMISAGKMHLRASPIVSKIIIDKSMSFQMAKKYRERIC
jgi:hypothetical protein